MFKIGDKVTVLDCESLNYRKSGEIVNSEKNNYLEFGILDADEDRMMYENDTALDYRSVGKLISRLESVCIPYTYSARTRNLVIRQEGFEIHINCSSYPAEGEVTFTQGNELIGWTNVTFRRDSFTSEFSENKERIIISDGQTVMIVR